MTDPDYEGVLEATKPQPRRGPLYTAEVNKWRKDEQMRRYNTAQARAYRALRAMHPVDYDALYRLAFQQVNEERGPLPGDDGWKQGG